MKLWTIITPMPVQRITYVYEPSWKIYALVTVLVGVILGNWYVISSAQYPSKCDQDATKVIQSSHGLTKKILTTVFNSWPHVYGIHNLSTTEVTIVTLWKNADSWITDAVDYSNGCLVNKKRFCPTIEYQSRIRSWHHCIDNTRKLHKRCEFLMVVEEPYMIMSDDAPDYLLHALNISTINVMGPPSDMFLRWLDVFLEQRVFVGPLRVLFTTHEWPNVSARESVTFGTAACVDNVITCNEVRG